MINIETYNNINEFCKQKDVTLVAVSKTKPVEDIQALYDLGQRDFGENYVQELVDKYEQLPKDIRWHFIGHLQSNKVKYIAQFVHLIHGVDSFKLFDEINKQGEKINRVVNCLLQVHIASEETKFGFTLYELDLTLNTVYKYKELKKYAYSNIIGLMGMASFTTDENLIRKEFKSLKNIYDQTLTTHHTPLTTLSMGMSSDYKIAIEEGSNMLRIGSLLFGERNYQ